ncbi:WD repeat, SAM and U-box domain-containing protein 1 [Agrilus planipennis]|uniref:WD repeat, SAM and U-box domain-containing protein 1 n=1 Tax=Agrilus planipennis TaxID=224129 RepID=A0A1W4XB82_AGRPL|nr:WD repeat, SAM and U-box domain-containing protein 1 [Agrilus planipennis]
METNFQNVRVLQSLTSHTSDVTSCDFSTNFVLVTGSSDKTVRVWDWIVGSGYSERSYSPLLGHKYSVTCVKLSPQGCMLASSSVDGTTVLWNMHSGSKIHVFVQINGDAVRVCRFSGDSTILVTASDNGALCVWDVIHKSLVRTVTDSEGTIQSLAFTPDSKYLVSGCSVEKIKIWLVSSLADTTNDFCLPLYSVDNAHDLGILYLDVSKTIDVDGILSDKLVKLFKIHDNMNIDELSFLHLDESHTYPVLHVEFSKSGKMLATCSLDGCAIVWNMSSGLKIFEIPQNSLAVKDCRFSADETMLITVGDDEKAYVWDIVSKSLIVMVQAHLESLTSTSFTPDDKLMVTVCTNGEIKLWNILTGTNIFTELYAHDLGINFCDFSENMEPNPLVQSNGKQNYLLATCGNDSLVKLWLIAYSKASESVTVKNWRTLVGHGGNVMCVRFSPKFSELVCSGATDKQLRVWSVYSGTCIQVLNHDSIVTCCCFNFDCSFLAGGCLDKTLWLWKLPEHLTVELSFTRKIDIRKKDVGEWNNDDVLEWLTGAGLQSLLSKVASFNMDGGKLLTMKDDTIFNELGFDEEEAIQFNKELKRLKEAERTFLNGFRSSELLNVPHRFFCPITHEIMREPVVCADGYTYEKQAINEWFMSGRYTSPMTNETLPNADFYFNNELLNEILEFFNDND